MQVRRSSSIALFEIGPNPPAPVPEFDFYLRLQSLFGWQRVNLRYTECQLARLNHR